MLAERRYDNRSSWRRETHDLCDDHRDVAGASLLEVTRHGEPASR